MAKFSIRSRYTDNVIFSIETDETESLQLAVEAAVSAWVDLSGADLYGADPSRADLYGAEAKFSKFPTIRLLSSINLGSLSAGLSLELMRRDAYAHPHPYRFDEWAKGGPCPYQREERFWLFDLRKEDWKPGKPEMTDVDLIRAICDEKKWEIGE